MHHLKGLLGDYIADYMEPGRGGWRNIVQVFSNMPNLVPIAQDLQNIMLETRIPLASHEDNFIWKETQSSTFSVKSAYRQLLRPPADVEC
ncbi:hypothetical protein SUGI_1152980 [Cryptomeria japonica]|nr:hypothetical protein SUGI_1152980 [Cryptomeria japonica]